MKYVAGINVDDEMLKNVDTYKFGEKKHDHIIRYRVKNMYNTFFKDELVKIQAQFLLYLIKSRKLK